MPRLKKNVTLKSLADGRLKSALIAQSEDVKATCYVLNCTESPELSRELRKLVKAWQASGPNLARLLKTDQAVFSRIRTGRTLLVPTNTGKGHLLWLPAPSKLDPRSIKDLALTHFMDLVVNPYWHTLGGPCARCDQYYVKKTKRQKAYCSRKCGAATTALVTTRSRRARDHAARLSKAQAAVDQWLRVGRNRPWKVWVSRKTKLTPKWLTRACNKGELRPPNGGSLKSS